MGTRVERLVICKRMGGGIEVVHKCGNLGTW